MPAAFLALLLAPWLQAQDPGAPARAPQRPRVALVLSSGGARGLAHVGALQALEELRVPCELVVGSESGALVGGLYASGLSPAEIEQALESRNWIDALEDRTPREALSFRAKQEDREFMLDLPIGLDAHGLIFPPGLMGGERLRLEIARLSMGALGERDFDRLPTAFRAVATDLRTGEALLLGSGSLATAIEASFSTPVLYPPVPSGERLLSSGALAEPLPVAAARELGADVVVALDLFDPLQVPERPDLYEVGLRVLGTLGSERARAARAALRPGDVLWAPELAQFEITGTNRAPRIVARARELLLAERERLAPLALDEAAWAEHQRQRAARRVQLPQLAGVRIAEDCPLAPAVMRARIHSEPGARLEERSLGLDLARLYGLRLFQRVDFELRPVDATHSELFVQTEDLATAPLHWRVGMQGELTAGSQVNLVAGLSLRYAPTDERGSEWRAHAEVGNRFLFSFEHRQALDAAGEWFLAPSAQWDRIPVNVDLGAAGSAQYSVEALELHLDVVHEFAECWEARAGPVWGVGSIGLEIGDPSATVDQSFEAGGLEFLLAQDSLDDTAFPRSGSCLRSRWFVPSSQVAPGQDQTVELKADTAFAAGRGSLVLGGELSTVTGNDGNVQSFFPLGGFLRLSGLHADELAGPTSVLARTVYFFPFQERGPERRTVSWYAGASLEAGNVFASFDEVRARDLLLGGALFLGVDSVFGPVYTGVGTTDGNGPTFFLVLGRYF